ncbi:hypothetical protein ASPVEDRAFT_36984 [Aspergillus versicolor CBS 583.65]|uniref:BZIP domain-containing protein n=1 Tax=Aspergillus versicolor CBS 583.65 TaxID=1036611 RepID=A0A1L9P7T7_ASPVE|nr:uncharacterized protein ASPVEDRAFT_36984 [Aspergillus versicolor CBS 583.65]OJI97562.1 hypothetical protein ASPVEDRAFT_36984 [Aspergillus versicolor CBS 583.65]
MRLESSSTHRQRKDAYFKNLENEVIRLREVEVDLHGQLKNARLHVQKLQGILDKHNLPAPSDSVGGFAAGMESGKYYDQGISALDKSGFETETNSPVFTSPLHLFDQHANRDISTGCTPSLNGNIQEPIRDAGFLSGGFQPTISQPRLAEHPVHQNMIDLGMEFVLSLESPCLPHLESHHDKPNGHVLLASTALMRPHPHRHTSSTSPVSSPHDPAVIFDRLLALSKDLVSEDTLSPVQAWSLILEHPTVSSLDITRTKQLSSSLLEIVKCYGFGAVMKRDAFESIISCHLPRLPL